MEDTLQETKAGRLRDVFATVGLGTIVTHAEISDILGCESSDDRRIARDVGKARSKLRVEHNRAIIAVPGHGYRIAAANEHITIGARYMEQGFTLVAAGLETVTHVRVDELTVTERNDLQNARQVMSWLAQQARAAKRKYPGRG